MPLRSNPARLVSVCFAASMLFIFVLISSLVLNNDAKDGVTLIFYTTYAKNTDGLLILLGREYLCFSKHFSIFLKLWQI